MAPSSIISVFSKVVFCTTALVILLLQGCANIQTPALPDSKLEALGVNVLQTIPDDLPSHLQQFEDTQFLVVQAKHASEFGVGLLIPIPFVADAAFDSNRKKKAKVYHEAYSDFSPYLVTVDKIKELETFYNPESKLVLHPMVVMTEGDDELFRISLFYQLQYKHWMSRYFYHLPTGIPAKDIAMPTEQQLAIFRDELNSAASQLLPVVQRDLAGDLTKSDTLATVGSLYVVGGKIGGLANPELIKMKGVEVLEDGGDHVLLRAPGNMNAHADDGGFWFGIHFFFKDQLFFFEIEK